ncbi:cation:proton antiporter regulatory subunit [Streptomyces griseoviridis]|uniref:TrkA domain protein n=3 Tax=Streptomyces TaxID=1883 RepID=A0ABT9LLU0_STRGD|nr:MULTISPECIES: cation:proton antiporter regulatory subunit [Streptomyces]MDP9684481.1 TrkA domain protein [Streptomyces griseoviridis]GGS51312.1 potassium transporter TrkA [Streptomyces niveoruber]GGT05849.1 potassium transporter TrkA [Streptomyces griseoviridis]GGU51916.1 potassium transporter TrkA [Streptomyces daghestanicus]GHI30557.1 potassium transporter TrkA [Streptomyces daghestanicus]
MSAPRLRATPLPGIGVQYDLVTREHRQLSVVAHRDGARTVNVYRADDPDSCAQSLKLTSSEAGALIDALKPSHHSASLLHTSDLGLVAERIEVSATSQWNGRLLGDTRMRTETGASIVAVLRHAEAVPSPTPDFRLMGGDTVIVIGTREGVDAAAAILGRE